MWQSRIFHPIKWLRDKTKEIIQLVPGQKVFTKNDYKSVYMWKLTTLYVLFLSLLNVEKESVLNKVKAILSSEQLNVVAYTTSGEPLTEEKYISHINQISYDIENGAKTFTSSEVKDFVLNHTNPTKLKAEVNGGSVLLNYFDVQKK